MPALGGDTATVLTGTSETVIVLVPLFVSLVAVIVAVPGATAVTNPVDDTVATRGVARPPRDDAIRHDGADTVRDRGRRAWRSE